mgnify:CR=1 FL=1
MNEDKIFPVKAYSFLDNGDMTVRKQAYIRADLVDELVGMLEKMVNDLVDERLSHWVPVENMFEDEEIIEIRQAIAKMKEEA